MKAGTVLVFLFIGSVCCLGHGVTALDHADYCYQCGSTGAEGTCKDDTSELHTHAMKIAKYRENGTWTKSFEQIIKEYGYTIPFIKRCNPTRQPYCLIEQVSNAQSGAPMSYIRGCSDGKTFSFQNQSRLVDLEPDNFTTCAYDKGGYQICVTLCKSFFCNGPVAGSTNTVISPCLLTMSLLIVLYLTLAHNFR